MNVHDVIGELLYIGSVAEKGRCYSMLRKPRGRKILRQHIGSLYDLQQCLQSPDLEATRCKINSFMEVCKKEHEIGRFYQFTDKEINIDSTGVAFKSIDQLMKFMLSDLATELQKIFINRRYVYDLLCALHNLPRVYLGTDKDTLCEINQPAISEQEAMEYSFARMSSDMKEKYQDMIIMVK